MNEQNIKDVDKFRQIGFGLSIMYLLNTFLYVFAEWLDLPDFFKVILFGFLGIATVLLGLFKFHKGLSYGFVIGGIFVTRKAWMLYHFKLTEFLQFLIALFLLACLSFALYRLVKNNNK